MEEYECAAEQVSPPDQNAGATSRTNSRRARTGGGQGRKSHACTECKRLKMRCEPLPGERRCSRCMRRGLECVYDRPYNPAVAMMPGSCETKLDQIGKDIHNIQSALESLLKSRSALVTQYEIEHSPSASGSSQGGTVPSTNDMVFKQDSDSEDGLHSHRNTPRHTAMTRENSPAERLTDDDISMARSLSMSQPMGSLYEVTKLRNLRFNQSFTPDTDISTDGPIDDFISKGIIKESEAEKLWQIFRSSLNHYLWVGIEQIHDTLDSVRRSSTLLTATILTVSALHVPSSNEMFDKCYSIFLDHISASMFARKHNTDDVRGLCIGAFWLSDVSWKLSGHAIRIATELGIHQSFHLALKGDREHFLRARLWYMLYVCDKHFSIAYGRPPMISENTQIREYERFLAHPLADILDHRIISQVALFSIINRVYDTLVQPTLSGEETSAMVPEDQLHHMQGFNREIDQWRSDWTTRMEANAFIGQFPVVGITLYSYFGKLLLNSLALRGINMSRDQISPERAEYANMAVSAAARIVSYVLEQPDLRRAMVGTPLYVHTMITWASVFLMKITTRWKSAGLNVEPTWVWDLLERMIQLMNNSMTGDRHVLHYIADGLRKMLDKSKHAAMLEAHAAHSSISTSASTSHMVPEFAHPHHVYSHRGAPADISGAGELKSSPAHGMSAYGQLGGDAMLPATTTTTMMQEVSAAGWLPAHGYPATCGAEMQQDPAAFDQMILNDSMIQEAFGGAVGYNVYDLLQNQFSSY